MLLAANIRNFLFCQEKSNRNKKTGDFSPVNHFGEPEQVCTVSGLRIKWLCLVATGWLQKQCKDTQKFECATSFLKFYEIQMKYFCQSSVSQSIFYYFCSV